MHGNVSSFGSANGISVVALADFGKPGVGGVDGSSGATGKNSSGGSASINNDEDEIEDDDLLALLEGDEDAERSPKNTDKSDMYGKTLKTAVARVQNSGSVSGSITARAQQLKRPLNKNSYTPQFYDVSLITSGNGVSMANYIETPDKYTYSQEKQNHVHLGSLDNSGNMRGQATLEGGTRTTHTYTKSKGSGNGVSLFASTGRFAKNATRVALDNVNNDGHISGQIRQISGNNSGYNSPHMMSGSEATGSGNGISLYSDTFNAQIPRVETRLGKINNRGSIRGDAYLKAGDGSGDLSIASRGINTVGIGIGQDLTYSTKAGSGELRGKLSLDYIHTSGEKDLQARFNGSDSGFTLRTDKNPNTVRAGLTGEYQTTKGVIIRAGVSDNLRKGKNDLQGTLSVGVKL